MNGCSKIICPMQVGTVDNCSLTREQCPYFTQDVNYQNLLELLEQIKAEVAREIFEEIDVLIDDWKHNRIQSIQFIAELAELKKKYIEDCTTCKHLVSCEPNVFGVCDEYTEKKE